MIIRVKKSEQEAIRFACSLHDIKVEFYTDERMDDLCFMELDIDMSKEPYILWYLSAEVQIKLQMMELEATSKKDDLLDMFKVNVGPCIRRHQ